MKQTEHRAHRRTWVHEIENDNMSIIRSKSELLCRLLLLLRHCETAQGKTTMFLPRYLSVRTKRARYTKDIRSKRARYTK